MSITEIIGQHGIHSFRQQFLKFGSLTTICNYVDETHYQNLLQRFRLWSDPEQVTEEAKFPNIFLVPYAPPFEGLSLSTDSISIQTNQKYMTTEIATRLVIGVLDQGKDPWQFFVALRPGQADEELGKYMFRVFNRFLALLDYLHVHGAASLEDEQAVLFVGDKGSGKSSICLHLGMQGKTVLSEDHIMLRQSQGDFFVSGCDDKMRVTQKSEEFFFDAPLSEAQADFAGTMKKEIDLSEHFDVRPYVDKPVGHIFFPAVGDHFSVEEIPSQQAFKRLIEQIWPLHRFADAQDQKWLMEFLGNLVMSTRNYALSLSRDLTDLSLLNSYLDKKNR